MSNDIEMTAALQSAALQSDDCVPCGLHEPQRNAYYDGKMLNARDLDAEQTYLNGMRYLGNMMLEGKGTVCGLKIDQHPTPGCRDSQMVLRRGMALTCCGQEIVVPQDTTIPFADMIRADPDLQDGLVDGAKDLVVKLCREDHPAEMTPVLISDCCADGSGQLPGRISEGYGFKLELADPGTLMLERQVIQPDLSWVHSINTEDETPVATAIDEEARLVYVASSLGEQAHVRAYSTETHAHVMTLTGFEQIHDVLAPSSSKWLFVTGVRDGAVVIALYRKTPNHLSEPEKVLALIKNNTNTGGEIAAQIAVSPTTGTLVALTVNRARRASLKAWPDAELDKAAPRPTNVAGGSERLSSPVAFHAGCRAIAISPDGQRVAIALPGRLTSAIYMVTMQKITDGSLVNLNDVEKAIVAEDGTDVTGIFKTACSLQFSFDSRVLHVTGQQAPEEGFYGRLSIDDENLVQLGRTATFALPANNKVFPEINVAPDERWIYIAGVVSPQASVGLDGHVRVFGTKELNIADPTPLAITPIISVALQGQICAGAMKLRGDRMYIPGFDIADDVKRGRVMVIDVAEADIKGIFEQSIDGCRTCGDACSCVTLGHVSGYVWSPEEMMRIVDIDQGNGAQIDNLSHRALVPSNAKLMEAILEIAARGIESGPPGPRGEDGVNGIKGADGAAGDNGTNGARGASITSVRYPTQLEMRNGMSLPKLLPVGDDFELVIERPEAPSGGFEPSQREDYFFVQQTNAKTGIRIDLTDERAVESLNKIFIELSEPVTNPEILLDADDPSREVRFLSGALEIWCHTWGTTVDVDPDDNEVGLRQLMPALQGMLSRRSFQYSPQFAALKGLTEDNQSFILDLNQLWRSFFDKNKKPVIERGRLDIVLHGTFLRGESKKPFDGCHSPDPDEVQPGETGGTWRTWIEFHSGEGS